MQEKNANDVKMSFKDYYKSLSELQVELKVRVRKRLRISDKTFYNLLNENRWSDDQLLVIEEVKAELTKEIAELC